MSIYEEVEIEDMIFNEKDYSYTYQCPCGDIFRITLEELHDGEDIAKCPSCTLRIMVVYDIDDLPPLPTEEDNDNEDESDDDDDEKGNESSTIDSKIVDQISSITVSG
jgi:diphthamide biosynthesis protein 3